MGTDTGMYKFLFLLHILGVVVGLGPVMLNGMYAAKARRAGGAVATGIRQANFEVSKVAEWLIYSIPITGFALLGMSDGVYELSQAWVWMSLVLYVVAIGIAHAVMIPSTKAILAGASDGEVVALDKKMAAGGMVLDVLVLVILVLMIWKP